MSSSSRHVDVSNLTDEECRKVINVISKDILIRKSEKDRIGYVAFTGCFDYYFLLYSMHQFLEKNLKMLETSCVDIVSDAIKHFFSVSSLTYNSSFLG